MLYLPKLLEAFYLTLSANNNKTPYELYLEACLIYAKKLGFVCEIHTPKKDKKGYRPDDDELRQDPYLGKIKRKTPYLYPCGKCGDKIDWLKIPRPKDDNY